METQVLYRTVQRQGCRKGPRHATVSARLSGCKIKVTCISTASLVAMSVVRMRHLNHDVEHSFLGSSESRCATTSVPSQRVALVSTRGGRPGKHPGVPSLAYLSICPSAAPDPTTLSARTLARRASAVSNPWSCPGPLFSSARQRPGVLHQAATCPTATLFIPCPSKRASILRLDHPLFSTHLDPFKTKRSVIRHLLILVLRNSLCSFVSHDLLLSLSRRRAQHNSPEPHRAGNQESHQFKMGLFNKKKKEADANPYAEQPFSNPMTPYQQARNNIKQGQPAVSGLPSGPRMASNSPAPSYHSQAPASNGYGNDQYGNQGGYGGDRYGSQSASPAPRAGGGYGGFDDDAGKSDLFGGAASRYVPPQQNGQNGMNSASPAPAAGGNRNPALFGNAQDRYNPVPRPQPAAADDEYGGYGAPRELTGKA